MTIQLKAKTLEELKAQIDLKKREGFTFLYRLFDQNTLCFIAVLRSSGINDLDGSIDP